MPSVFIFAQCSGGDSRSSPPSPLHPPLPAQMVKGHKKTRAIKSHNILQKLGSIQSPAVLSLKGCSPGGLGGRGGGVAQ